MPKSADKPMKWLEAQERALALAFDGRWSQAEIAKKCDVSPRTIWGWLTHPEFQARLEALRADFAGTLRGVAYADKAQRIMGLAQMAESARRQYEDRPWLQEIRPLPQKAAVRIRRRVVDADTPSPDGSPVASDASHEASEPAEGVTEPLDAIVNESFNEAAFNAFREALTDIAAELGARKNVTELSGALDVNSNVSFYLPQPEEQPPDDDNDERETASASS